MLPLHLHLQQQQRAHRQQAAFVGQFAVRLGARHQHVNRLATDKVSMSQESSMTPSLPNRVVFSRSGRPVVTAESRQREVNNIKKGILGCNNSVLAKACVIGPEPASSRLRLSFPVNKLVIIYCYTG